MRSRTFYQQTNRLRPNSNTTWDTPPFSPATTSIELEPDIHYYQLMYEWQTQNIAGSLAVNSPNTKSIETIDESDLLEVPFDELPGGNYKLYDV